MLEVAVFTACWSVKGGSGTTVVATSLALAGRRVDRSALIADLAGDVPAALGLAEPPGPGLADWLAAGPSVPDDALARLVVPVSGRVGLLALGAAGADSSWADHGAGVRLGHGLRALAGGADLIVDCGRADSAVLAALVESSDRSLLVLRPCYLALRRALAAPRPTGVALMCEPDRALGAADIEAVLGVPVLAEIAWDPAVARAVDAGLMATRIPRRLLHALRGVAA